jgi:phosphatidylglycerol:prolipoprotein diacylglycerol transferase
VHPVLEIGAWRLQSWGVLNAAACIVALVGALARARRRGVAPGLLVRLWPWCILGGVAGGHLYYLAAGSDVPWWQYGSADVLDVFRGQAIQGGFIGGGLAALVFLRLARAPVWPVLDVMSPAGAAAQALTRVGCFLAGCCHGSPAPTALGVVYTDPASLAPRGVPLYPAQLFESAALVGLAAYLFTRLRHRDAPDGRVFALYVGGYGVIRFVVQFFRGDDADRLVLGLAHSQYTALVMMLLAALFLRARERQRTRRTGS